MPQRLLAIELKQDVVRAALAERSWHSLELVGTYRVRREAGEADIRGALERLMRQVGRVDVVLSSVPGELVAKRLLELPFAKRRQLEQAVPFALEEHLPFGIDEGVVSFLPPKSTGNGSRVMAMFVTRQSLRSHLELLAGVGLDPKIVTVSALALPALLTPRTARTTPWRIFVELDSGCAAMVLCDAEGMVRAFRAAPYLLSANGDAGQAAVRDSSLMLALRQTLGAFPDISSQAELVVLGEHAANLSGYLASELSLRAVSPDLTLVSELFGRLAADHLGFAGCLGLLLAEHPQVKLQLPNFRQGEFIFLGRVADLSPWRVPMVLAGIMALFAAMHMSLEIATRYRKLDLVDARISALAAPALGRKPASDVLSSLRHAIVSLRKELWTLGGQDERISPLEVLLGLSRALTPELGVELDEVSIDDNVVKLSGRAESYAGVGLLKQALSKEQTFSDIEVAEARSAGDGSKVEFRASLHVRARKLKRG